MNLKIINVDNGNNNYPGNFCKKEIEIIKKNILPGLSLNLFSGKSSLGNVRIDYSFGNFKMNVFNYLNSLSSKNEIEYIDFKTVIIDFPYNDKFAKKYQKIGNTPKQFIGFANTKDTTILFNHLIRLEPKRIIIKSWNYYIVKGYKLKKGYLCYPGGYRKSTLLLIMDKIGVD